MACSVSNALGSADIGEWWETEPFRASSKARVGLLRCSCRWQVQMGSTKMDERTRLFTAQPARM